MAWPFNKVGNMSYYEHEVVGHPDVELGLCGERQVRYRIHGAEQAGSGLVVYIPDLAVIWVPTARSLREGGRAARYGCTLCRLFLHAFAPGGGGRHLLAARGA